MVAGDNKHLGEHVKYVQVTAQKRQQISGTVVCILCTWLCGTTNSEHLTVSQEVAGKPKCVMENATMEHYTNDARLQVEHSNMLSRG